MTSAVVAAIVVVVFLVFAVNGSHWDNMSREQSDSMSAGGLVCDCLLTAATLNVSVSRPEPEPHGRWLASQIDTN